MTPNNTFDRIMANPKRQKTFEQGYHEFLLSELLIALSQRDDNAVSELLTTLLPNHRITAMEGPSQEEMTLRTFLQVMSQLGYEVTAKRSPRNAHSMHLSQF